MSTAENRIVEALGIAECGAMIDGAHHKQWVIDQMIRAMLGEGYSAWRLRIDERRTANDLEPWDDGIAP